MYEPQEYIYKIPTSKAIYEPARFWRRFAVFLIDFIFFTFAVYNPFMNIYLHELGIPINDININAIDSRINDYVTFGASIAGVIFLIYFVLLEQMYGFTIGGYFLKTKVLTLDGKRPSIIQGILRNLTKSVFMPFLLLDLFGFIIYRKRLTEVLSGTEVFYVPTLQLRMG